MPSRPLSYMRLVHHFPLSVKYWLGWAIGKCEVTFSGLQKFPSYVTYVESLPQRLELNSLKYQMETIILPWGGPCTFPVFNFPSIFHHLLDNPHCHKHLLIDWEHPSCCPHHKIGWLDDVHSAKWYADTHHMQIQSNSNEVLCGIILFIEGG